MQTKLLRNAQLLTSSFCLCSAVATAQSFDCGKAATKVEKTICGNKMLGDLDMTLSHAFRELLDKNPDYRQQLISEEHAWIASRDRECVSSQSTIECLSNAINDRTLYLLRRDIGKEQADRQSIAICNIVADKYGKIAKGHSGESPLTALSKSPGSHVIVQ
ncbi:MAG: lysozyme inhibitor LprI family protein, partial [Steroidobacter sp.]